MSYLFYVIEGGSAQPLLRLLIWLAFMWVRLFWIHSSNISLLINIKSEFNINKENKLTCVVFWVDAGSKLHL
ncbi:hypothetical protein Sps_03150 [Shewanella psychrophila]|uniref:Uncharacterized protein n=1 Tax=Shewanella psychrophila TaxID=225848 RepID=A0A1S6HRY8_9GAMM|nr:hypothetical protein Sps_03150 [Shewanella psychrophila]